MITTIEQRSRTAASASTMKAVLRERYGSADVLRFGDVQVPEIADGEVLVRVRAAGLDRGVWHLMTGQPYLMRIAGFGVRRPKKPGLGTDLAGVVEIVGKNVTRFQPGDEVFGVGDGTFAEYARAAEDKLAHKPAGLTFEQAAAIPVSASTALQALRDQGRAQPGHKVLVIGASGGVGTFAVQLAKAFGAHVTGVCSTAKVELVRSIGADHVVDYTREDLAGGGEHYDLIVDIAGNRPVSDLRRALTPKGTLVFVGGEGGGRLIGETVARELRALPTSPFISQRLRMFVASVRGEDLQVLRQFIEAGKLMPVVDRSYALAEVPQAIRDMEAGRIRGKAVISVS